MDPRARGGLPVTSVDSNGGPLGAAVTAPTRHIISVPMADPRRARQSSAGPFFYIVAGSSKRLAHDDRRQANQPHCRMFRVARLFYLASLRMSATLSCSRTIVVNRLWLSRLRLCACASSGRCLLELFVNGNTAL